MKRTGTKKKRNWIVGAVILIMTLALAACGENSGANDSNASTDAGGNSTEITGTVQPTTEPEEQNSEPLEEFLYYEDYGNTARIYQYNGAGGVVTLPAEIDGKRVTECNLKLGDSSPVITEIIISEGCEYFPYFAWYSETGAECPIEKITIPASITEVTLRNPFGNLTRLKEIVVAEGNPTYFVEDGILFVHSTDGRVAADGDGYTAESALLCYPAMKEGDTYYQDSTVIAASHAFQNARYLKKLENTLGTMGSYEGSMIEELTMRDSDSYNSIGQYYFSNAAYLKKITFAAYPIVDISESAFSGCSSLEELIMPAGKDEIETGYFTEDGVLYRKRDDPSVYYTLMKYPDAKPGEEYTTLCGKDHIRDYEVSFTSPVYLKKLYDVDGNLIKEF